MRISAIKIKLLWEYHIFTMDISIQIYIYIYIYIYDIATWSTKRYLETYSSMHISCTRQSNPQGLHAVAIQAKQRNIPDLVPYMMHNVYSQQLLTDDVMHIWAGPWPQISQLRLWIIPSYQCIGYVVRGYNRVYHELQDIRDLFWYLVRCLTKYRIPQIEC